MRDVILIGDVRAKLAEIPAGSVHCCVTSPPYWALRDYGVPGQLGSEPTPEEYLANQMDVFRGVRRVLRDDGVLWVNLGDNYDAAGGQNLMPHRFALAMMAEGWILRSTVIWSKRSPMPESLSGWRWVRHQIKTGRLAVDWSTTPKCSANGGYVLRRGGWRCTTAHEYVFQFVKSRNYFCDGDAVAELASQHTHGKNGRNRQSRTKTAGLGGERNNTSFTNSTAGEVETRNPRSVWTLSTEPYKAAHFATFPTALPRKCIEASTSKAGCCPACGSQYAPVIKTERVPTRSGENSKVTKSLAAIEHGSHNPNMTGNRDPQRHIARTVVTGYWATCSCNSGEPVPAIVLDPYLGSGTTAQVAHQLGRSYIGIELNPEYAALARERIKVRLKDRTGKASGTRKRRKKLPRELLLFNE